jgi:hypothetical protein
LNKIQEIALFASPNNPVMKTSSIKSFIGPVVPFIIPFIFFVTAIIFGVTAFYFGKICEFNISHANQFGAPDQFIHADAGVYGCSLISAACFITSGLIVIKQIK